MSIFCFFFRDYALTQTFSILFLQKHFRHHHQSLLLQKQVNQKKNTNKKSKVYVQVHLSS
jgi:hypothetical protein